MCSVFIKATFKQLLAGNTNFLAFRTNNSVNVDLAFGHIRQQSAIVGGELIKFIEASTLFA